MGLHKISKGLDLPIQGQPEQRIEAARTPSRVALLGDDYVGMKPTMHVAVGDKVRRGQLLFEDKKTPGVRYTSPAAGTVVAINRGAKRAFQSVVIQLDPGEAAGKAEEVSFRTFRDRYPTSLSRDDVKELLLESGLWTALRARPFGRVADPQATPHSIFVTAMDSNPLAPDLDLALEGGEGDFERGLEAVSRLSDGPIYVCKTPGSRVAAPAGDRFREEAFAGPHPAGTVGLHIHLLDPVDRHKLVWHLGLQDVFALGKLFTTGRLHVERIISLAGPGVRRPRLLRTRLGAAVDDLVADDLLGAEQRIISGSVLSGRTASGEGLGFLGRYHNQISVLPEGREREFLGWLVPGVNKFSTTNAFLSKLALGKRFAMTTSKNGSDRAIIPIGMYERVMPLDLMPTFLLKALVMGDVDRAGELGCLELEEEDLALCTFVCPGKIEYGPYLRETLTILEKEG